MWNFPLGSSLPVLLLVAAGVEAESGRIAFQRMQIVVKQSRLTATQRLSNSSPTTIYIIRSEESPGDQSHASQNVLSAECGAC
jgi:hypothetical protein